MVKAVHKTEPSLTSSSKTMVKRAGDFQKALEGISLSKHAYKRLTQRGVPFDAEVARSLSEGIDQVEAKGGHEALLLLKDSAYIVGVPKRQLITAFKVEDLQSNVVTNIDTAVILGSKGK